MSKLPLMYDSRRGELAAAQGMGSVEIPFSEIFPLLKKLSLVLEGEPVPHGSLALLMLYFLIHSPHIDMAKVTDVEKAKEALKEMAWFADEGSFQLSSLLRARQEVEKGGVVN